MSLGLVKSQYLEVWKQYIPALKREKITQLLSLQQREERVCVSVCSFQLRDAWEADGPTLCCQSLKKCH